MAGEVATQRNKPKLPHDGHLYVFSKMSAQKDIEIWRCQYKNNKTLKCLARLHKVKDTGEIEVKGRHTDMPSAVAMEVAGRKTALKRRAAETKETPQQMINFIRATSSLAAQGVLESDKTLARVTQRNRNRLGIGPTHFTNLAYIVIPEEFTTYESSPGTVERFLLGDSGPDDPNRIHMFGREGAAQWIGHVSKLYVDGTFSLTPDLFSQVFVILAERPGIVIPMCYVLLPNKLEFTYCKVSS